MAKQYFFSPDLSECAGCGTHLHKVNGFGTVALETAGNPLLHYTLCRNCTNRNSSRDRQFALQLEAALVKRAYALGAYKPDLTPPRNLGGLK